MSHNNGRIYDSNIAGNSDGVSVYDVQQTLGINSTDFKDLCTHTNINMWAKYKPIQVSTIAPLTHAIHAGISEAVAGKAYGLETIAVNASFETFLGLVSSMIYSTGHQGYVRGMKYNKPAGGGVDSNGHITGSPYRISDFADKEHSNKGYYHSAKLQHSPSDSTTQNLTLTYRFRPEGEGYTEDNPQEVVQISTNTNYYYYPDYADLNQEETAWANHNPERTIDNDAINERNLSVSIFDIMAPTQSIKNNFFDATATPKIKYNRGFLMMNGSAFRWCVMPCHNEKARIPFGYWLQHAGTDLIIDSGWSFVEFYTNAPIEGNGDTKNYNETKPATSYFFCLIPDAIGTIELALSESSGPAFRVVSLGYIYNNGATMDNSFQCLNVEKFPSTGISCAIEIEGEGGAIVQRTIYPSELDMYGVFHMDFTSDPTQYLGLPIKATINANEQDPFIATDVVRQ